MSILWVRSVSPAELASKPQLRCAVNRDTAVMWVCWRRSAGVQSRSDHSDDEWRSEGVSVSSALSLAHQCLTISVHGRNTDADEHNNDRHCSIRRTHTHTNFTCTHRYGNVPACTPTHTHTHIYANVHTSVQYAHVPECTPVHTCTHTYVCKQLHTHTHTHVNAYMHSHTYAHAYTSIKTHT